MKSLDLESLVLAAIVDDAISPGFIHERLTNDRSTFAPYLSRTGLDAPRAHEITQILAIALAKGLVTCRLTTDEKDEMLNSLPRELAESDETMMYQLWFELTPAGEQVAEAAIQIILS